MKIEYKGLTDESKLIDTIIEYDRLGTTRNTVKEIILPMMERCIEVWLDGKRAGYLMIFNTKGRRSFHGYKLIKGHAKFAIEVAREFINRYPDLFISHHVSRDNISRLAKILGFKETFRTKDIVMLEKNNVSPLAVS